MSTDYPNVDHIGLAVADLDEAIRLFTGAFGVPVEPADAPAGGARVAFLRLGNSDIELVQPTSPDHAMAAWLAHHGPGIHHIALRSDDVQASAADLAAKGVRLENPAPVAGARDSRIVNLETASLAGAAFQLVQREYVGEADPDGPCA